MFRGINGISIDAKGRIVMPTRYREHLTNNPSIVLTIDTEERCLLMYLLPDWEEIERKLATLPSFNPAARRIQRLLMGHATDVEMDGQGRILLPSLLREYAGLVKNAVLVGQGKKFELWDETLWNEKRSDWLQQESDTSSSTLPDEVKAISLELGVLTNMAACHMNDNFHQHVPVLLQEAIAHLITSPDGLYVDATFGRGSHSRAILSKLSPKGRLIAFDKDPEAVAYAKTHFAEDKRFTIVHASFANLAAYLTSQESMSKVSGILFDLGVSSPQLDNPARGFSFTREGKLDMRMDTTQGQSAMDWLAEVDEVELAKVLWEYGEEKFSRRIARAIVSAREISPITTTGQLADLIKYAMPKPKKPHDKHPATRSFQAIRIAINHELTELESGLDQALEGLQPGGRLCVISFHSLEDRAVKEFIRHHEKGVELPRGLPIKGMSFQARLISIGKPVKPSLTEVNLNPRARSAILRIAEKQS